MDSLSISNGSQGTTSPGQAVTRYWVTGTMSGLEEQRDLLVKGILQEFELFPCVYQRHGVRSVMTMETQRQGGGVVDTGQA